MGKVRIELRSAAVEADCLPTGLRGGLSTNRPAKRTVYQQACEADCLPTGLRGGLSTNRPARRTVYQQACEAVGRAQTWGLYHGGRRPSSDDSFQSPTVIPPSTLDTPSIMKRHHRRRTCSHTSPRRSPTMVTHHDTRFVECRWWNDGLDFENCRHLTVVGLHDTGHQYWTALIHDVFVPTSYTSQLTHARPEGRAL